MAKLNSLKASLDAIKDQAAKAFTEIRSKVDALDLKIVLLTEQLGDAEIPADAQTSLDEITKLTQQLDDIVPDAPPAE